MSDQTSASREPAQASYPRSPVRAPNRFPPIVVVPLDGSIEAKAALPAARLAARILQGTVHVVQAVDSPLPGGELLRRMNLTPDEAANLVVDQVVGPAVEAIVRFAEQQHAFLIVMTTRGHTAYRGRTVRPVVERVIRDACRPVLLVRPEIVDRAEATTRLRQILLPLDGAPSSAAVIGPALHLAQESGSDVDILYVAEFAQPPAEPGSLTTPLYVDQPQYEWPEWAKEFARRFGTAMGEYPLQLHTRMYLRRGEPASQILHFAIEHRDDLIVLEWRGRLDPDHARVVRTVLSAAPCPVLLIRTTRC